MSGKISFVLKRIDGSSQSFCANPLSTFVEVIGAAPLADSILLHDGQLVNKYLSLAHENITEGSVVVTAQQKRRQRRAKMDLSRKSISPDGEAARIHDVLWSGWELSRHHNRMVSLLIHKADKAVPRRRSRAAVMNTEPAAEIGTSPLPTWFKDGTVTGDEVPDDKDS